MVCGAGMEDIIVVGFISIAIVKLFGSPQEFVEVVD
jgi:hypothetical protein